MKKYLMLTTAMVAAGLFVHHETLAQNNMQAPPSITSNAASTADNGMGDDRVQDPRVAAQRFIEHINYARVALALKNGDLAQKHINQAENMAAILKTHASDEEHIESGRVTYNNDGTTMSRYHYYPIETGPLKVETLDSGPFWASSEGLSVTDADIVYVSLDMRGNKVARYLDNATTDISQGKFVDADKNLADLISATVTTEDKETLPAVKARDNIALAHDFILMRNYDGARYALNHADDALDAMKRDDRYKANMDEIGALRGEVKEMQAEVERKDPSMLEKASATTTRWWNQMSGWVDAKTE